MYVLEIMHAISSSKILKSILVCEKFYKNVH